MLSKILTQVVKLLSLGTQVFSKGKSLELGNWEEKLRYFYYVLPVQKMSSGHCHVF
jgi:hypothetical protein